MRFPSPVHPPIRQHWRIQLMNLTTQTSRILIQNVQWYSRMNKTQYKHSVDNSAFTVWERHRILVLGLVPPRKNSIELLLYGNLVFVNTSTKLQYNNSSILFFLGDTSPSTNIWCCSQLKPNFGEMVFRWSPFRIVSDDPARQPRRPTSTDIILTWDPMGKMLKKSSLKLLGLIGTKL